MDNHSKKEEIEFILSGIQFYHDCKSAVKSEGRGNNCDRNETEEDEEDRVDDTDMTQEVIHQVQEAQIGWPEHQYAQGAIDVACLCGIFQNDREEWLVKEETFLKGTEIEMNHLKLWKDEMNSQLQDGESDSSVLPSFLTHPDSDSRPSVDVLTEEMMNTITSISGWETIFGEENSLSGTDPSELNVEQVSTYNFNDM